MTGDEFRTKLKLEYDLFTAKHGHAPSHMTVSQRAYDLLRGPREECHTFMDCRVMMGPSMMGARPESLYVEIYGMGMVKYLQWDAIVQEA